MKVNLISSGQLRKFKSNLYDKKKRTRKIKIQKIKHQ